MKKGGIGAFILIIAVSAVMLSGCTAIKSAFKGTGINKLIKSGDREMMYESALNFYKARKYQKTLTLLEEVAPYYTGTTRSDTIVYYMGSAYYKMGDFESSAYVFDDFRRSYQRSPFLEDSEYMLAMGYYYSSPDPEKDQAATKKAIVAINEFLSRYPNTVKKESLKENIEELTQKLHDKAFLDAKTYYTTGKYKSAAVALKNALNQYPDTKHREEIMYMTAKSSYLLAKNSIETMQRDRYLNMLDDYYAFVGEFPDSKYRKEMDKAQVEAKAFLAKFSSKEEK